MPSRVTTLLRINAHNDGTTSETEQRFRSILSRIIASEDVRMRAAYAKSLGVAVEDFWNRSTQAAHEKESVWLESTLQSMMKSDEQLERLAGIAAIIALLKVTSNEAFGGRVLRTGLSLISLETINAVHHGDVETSEASVDLLRVFSKERGRDVRRLVTKALMTSLDDLINPESCRRDVTRAYFRARMVRNCILVTKIGPLYPEMVLTKIENTVEAVASFISDKLVGEYAVPCVVAILSICAQTCKGGGDAFVASHYLVAAYEEVRVLIGDALDKNLLKPASTSAADIQKVYGVIVLIAKLLGCPDLGAFLGSPDTESDFDTRYVELGVYLLDYRRCLDQAIQGALAVGLMNLAKFDIERFCGRQFRKYSFAAQALEFLFQRARNTTLDSKTRGDAIRAAGGIAETIGSDKFLPFLESALTLCNDLLAELLRDSRHRDGDAIDQSERLSSGVRQQMRSTESLGVLEFVRHVTRATATGDETYAAKADTLLPKLFKFDASISLVRALKAVTAVVKGRDFVIQRMVMTKVEKVFVESAEALSGNFSSSGIPVVDEGPLRNSGSRDGILDSDNNGRGCEVIASPGSSAEEKLFVSRSLEKVEHGYVTAISGIQRQSGGAQAHVDVRDVDFDLELSMDPAFRRGSAESGHTTKATPRAALKILTGFPFDTVSATRLALFANQFLVSFLEEPSIVDRRLALQAIANLMEFAAKQGDEFVCVGGLRDNLFMVMSQLASVAVTDPSRRVRLTSLTCMDEPHFELYVAQPEILRCLGQCLQDEDVGVRGQALKIVCRLYKHDSAEVEPVLKQFLVHLLTVLRFPAEAYGGMRAQASRLLQMLICDCRGFVELFSKSIADVLLLLLQNLLANVAKVDSSATLPVLEAIGDLASIFDVALGQEYVNVMVSLLVVTILDVETTRPHSQFRAASLRALARVVQNSSLSCRPYVSDERLLASLVSDLRAEMDPNVRIETLQLLGAIGVANPDKEHIKYIALPSGTIASTSSAAGAPLLYQFADGKVLAGSSGLHSGGAAAGSEKWITLATEQTNLTAQVVTGIGNGVAESVAKFVPNANSLSDLGEDGDMVPPLFDVAFPPLVADAANSSDIQWIQGVLAQSCPSWKRRFLRTDSLVNRLNHPYTESDLYYPSVVLDVLHEIVGLVRHSAQHVLAVESIVLVCGVIKHNNECSYFLPSIVPRLLWMLQPVDPEGRLPISYHIIEIFSSLENLIAVVKTDFQSYLPDTIALCHAYLTDDDAAYRQSAFKPISRLLRTMAREFGKGFRPYAVYVLGPIVCTMMSDATPKGAVTSDAILTIVAFGDLYADYSCVVLPALVAVAENENSTVEIRQLAIFAIESALEIYSHASEFVPSVLHALIRILATADSLPVEQACSVDNANNFGLAKAAIGAIQVVALAAPVQFTIFVPMIAKALCTSGAPRDSVESRGLEAALLNSNADVAAGIFGHAIDGHDLSELAESLHAEYLLGVCARRQTSDRLKGAEPNSLIVPVTLETDALELLRAFEVSDDMQGSEWTDWIDRLGVALLNGSSSPAMRAVAKLGEHHPFLVRALFNAAFLSCWTGLKTLEHEEFEKIIDTFRRALESRAIPLHSKQTLLDLFEFMDHDERPFPLPVDLLTSAALDVGAHAKALRQKEIAYTGARTTDELLSAVVDRAGLIEIYNSLGHNVSAKGTLKDFAWRTSDEDVGREVKEQYSETMKLLPEALREYSSASQEVGSSGNLSTVNAESERRGRELYKSRAARARQNHSDESQAAVRDDWDVAGGIGNETDDEKNRDLKWFLTLSQLRLLDKLGQWREMESMAEDVWKQTEGNKTAQVSLAVEGRACSVAFDLSNIVRFRERVQVLDGAGNWDEHFYKTLLCILEAGDKRDLFLLANACKHISEARKVLDVGLRTRAAEGYPRAYGDFLNAQHLVELEEMIECVRAGNHESGRNRMKSLWEARRSDAREDHHTCYRLLMIRSLLLDPSENQDHWLKFATKCRKGRRLPMATEVLRKLLQHVVDAPKASTGDGSLPPRLQLVERLLVGSDKNVPSVSEWATESIAAVPDRAVQFACIKHMWAAEEYKRAFHALKECAQKAYTDMVQPSAQLGPNVPTALNTGKGQELTAKIFLKLAKWSDRLNTPTNTAYSSLLVSSTQESLYYAKKATEWRPTWYKSWHFWASLNANAANAALARLQGEARASGTKDLGDGVEFGTTFPPLTDGIVSQYMCAINGYTKAIAIGGKTSLQDILTLLSLWFKFGSHPKLSSVFMYNFNLVNPIRWLDVVPQIIARLHTPNERLRNGMEQLVTRIGITHPHAIVYPLTVAANTPGRSKAQDQRRKSAALILSGMKSQHRDIVEQAAIMATELDRVAILDHETWYVMIEEASRIYCVQDNPAGMLELLRPLHEKMTKSMAVTPCEEKFREDYGSILSAAYELGQEYLVAYRASERNAPNVDPAELQRQQGLIERAWELYCQVGCRIQRRQLAMKSLDMENVSPHLANRKNFVLVVPGTYRPQTQVRAKDNDSVAIKLVSFERHLDVIKSNQRPRKLQVLGSDGKRYGFLLKGNDDLRKDERVMQVFGLMNEHLAQSEDRSVREGTQIKRYNVVVLSSNAGLIEWVPQCDTMQHLVKTFREKRGIVPDVEHKVMLRVAPGPERLTFLERVQQFQFMLQNTNGRDIARVLWLQSRNSEMWLDRRTNFARTLATTSMAGYILGLGDRHPANIMIERETGKIMHIDFGDCFEVAMQRDKFPETVPFRLTRMLVQALEPCGVGGQFRNMAVAIMRVLRQEVTQAAVLSMMEAFIYDPLVRQRHIDAAEATKNDEAEQPVRASRNELASTGHIAHQYGESQTMAAISARAVCIPDVAGAEPTPSQHSKGRASVVERDDTVMSSDVANIDNQQAASAIRRVHEKLTGTDFEDTDGPLIVEDQVDRLIDQATSVENLCVLYSGYLSCW